MNKGIRITGLVFFVVSCMVLFSCKLSTGQLAKEVQNSMVEAWKEGNANVRVTKDLTLVKIADTVYSGLMTVSAGGETEQISVSVIYDGDSFVWEIE